MQVLDTSQIVGRVSFRIDVTPFCLIGQLLNLRYPGAHKDLVLAGFGMEPVEHNGGVSPVGDLVQIQSELICKQLCQLCTYESATELKPRY